MRILHCVSSMNPKAGGVTQAVNTYLRNLINYNVYSTVVTLDHKEAAHNISTDFVALGPSSRVWRYSALYKPWLEANILTYDIVILHGIWLYQDYAIFKVREKYIKMNKKVPKLYIMLHGMLDAYFQNDKKRFLKAIRNSIYWHLIQRRIINKANGLLYTTDEEMDASSNAFWGYKPNNVFNVGLGIEEPPKSRDSNILSVHYPNFFNSPYMLYLGRIDAKKGIDLLIDAYYIAYTKFWAQRSNLPKLVIAGPGLETKYGIMLQQKVIGTSHLSENICFTGMLEGNLKWAAFNGCETFISPSHHENFGISVVEAMACKKPVLITNKINIFREIQDNNCGFVENDDLEGCVALLTKWISTNAAERQLMADNAYKTYEMKFKDEQAIANFYNFISGANV